MFGPQILIRATLQINTVNQCLCYILDGTSNGSDSKKLRVEEAPPSRVLHIRKLPNEASETEIIALGLPFGKVTNILTLKGKNQVSGGNFCFAMELKYYNSIQTGKRFLKIKWKLSRNYQIITY